MFSAPFPPLVAGGAGLEHPPAPPLALRRRMAEVYGVVEACVLPVAGAALAIDVLQRDGDLTLAASPDPEAGEVQSAAALNRLAAEAPLLIVDERFIEFADASSFAPRAAESRNVIVIRSLEIAYGLAGAPCAALIAPPDLIAKFTKIFERTPLPTPTARLAEAALDPVRAPALANRIDEIKAERRRIGEALAGAGVNAVVSQAPFVFVNAQASERLRAFGVAHTRLADGRIRLDVRDREANDRALAAFGIEQSRRSQRRAEVLRETSETKIVAQLDLDAPGPVRIETGVEFYDHMLSQIAVHGGFALTLQCDGDLGIDAHHTIEDCALALGQALSQALAARKGIARFGFVLPMDEAQAQVSVDLGGRPYLVFEGAFTAPLLGAYPTEMTEHVFRSLAQTMGAAIHLSVTGDNDHHKTEACFKAFGRALRQAIRVEGEAVPSSKGVI